VSVDLEAARRFVATHGRVLDRRRFEVVSGGGDASTVLSALSGYRNPDAGYGWGLEPDLRARESQPAAAMHALEAMSEVAELTPTPAVELCDWLLEISLPDGGLPLALPVSDPTGCARFWIVPDPGMSSLQMTAQVAANAHLVGRHDEAVRSHPWLVRATDWCLTTVRALDEAPAAHELLFALRFVDALGDHEPGGPDLLERLGHHIPADGVVPVSGGSEDEVIRPLDLSPDPDGVVRRLFGDDVIGAELDLLAGEQRDDGGWTVGFESASGLAAMEWRGYATVAAIQRLRDHGRLP
jgi:hypothetical protein